MSTEDNNEERVNNGPSVSFDKVYEANDKLMDQGYKTFRMMNSTEIGKDKFLNVNLLRQLSAIEIDAKNPINSLIIAHGDQLNELGDELKTIALPRNYVGTDTVDIDDLRDFVIDSFVTVLSLARTCGFTKDELLTQSLARIETQTETFKQKELEQ